MEKKVAEVLPFKGLLYNCEKVDVKDVIAPPYDVITPDERERFYRKSPYNVVRLILGRSFLNDNEKNNWYIRAKRLLEEWMKNEILIRDREPSFYLYKQLFEKGGKVFERLALLARVRLSDLSEGKILPHERTLSAPKLDRLRLLKACRVNFSPIFGIVIDGKGEFYSLLRVAELHSPIFSFADDDGILHNLWKLRDAAVEVEVSRKMRDKAILIADGHHRYETALEFKKEMESSNPLHRGNEPYNFAMMALVSIKDPGLLILPTHRVVWKPMDINYEIFWNKINHHFQVVKGFSDVDTFLRRLDASPGSTFGIFTREGELALLLLKPRIDIEKELPNLSPALRTLGLSVLHHLIIDGVLGLHHEEIKEKLGYFKDALLAIEAVNRGEAEIAFLVKAPTIGEVREISESGETMPQKSTYFYPKLITGLVMNPLFD